MKKHYISSCQIQAVCHLVVIFFIGFCLSVPLCSAAKSPTGNTAGQGSSVAPTPAKVASAMQSAPLLFTENRGQVADNAGKLRPDVLFTARNGATRLYLTATGIHYQFTKTTYPAGYSRNPKKVTDHEQQAELAKKIQTETYRFSLTLASANPHPVVRSENKNTFTENFYTSTCPNGITNVATYGQVVYEDVYPHIDWVVYNNGNRLKYDFLVHPGGDPAQIKLKIEDAKNTSITKAGELLMTTTLGEVREHAPVSFTGDKEIATSFKKNDDGTISFNVPPQPGQELRIDPSVDWATYYGGADYDQGSACAADASGNVYMVGESRSAGLASSGGYQDTLGSTGFNGADGLIVKFDASGNRLWATYYGGIGDDDFASCAIDTSGNLYVVGQITSPGFASVGAFQTAAYNSSAILAKFNASGNRLWATYYGGLATGATSLTGCAVDAAGNVFIVGGNGSSPSSTSTGLATVGAYQFSQAALTSTDGILAKFDSTGNRLWATYYGGSGQDEVESCTVDAAGNVYITGLTLSVSGIASAGAYQSVYGGGNADVFLVKFDGSGARKWATYYGGSAFDQGLACATDADGSVYIAGTTYSPNGIASIGAVQAGNNGQASFLVKFDSLGSRLWGTYYGGGPDGGEATGCATDGHGNVYIAGSTSSATGVASGGFMNTFRAYVDAMIAKFSGAGSLLWGSYYGGGDENCYGLAAHPATGKVYITGLTESSSDISTSGAYQVAFGGANYDDAFLVQIADPYMPPVCAPTYGSVKDTICASQLPYTWNGKTVTAAGTAAAFDTLVNTQGCDSIITLSLAITAAPTLAFTASAINACKGQAGVIYKVIGNTPVSYTWNYTGTGATISGTGDSVQLSFSNTATSGQVQVTAINGCGLSTTRNLPVIVNAVPVVMVTGNGVVCVGGIATLIASGAITYNWLPDATLSATLGNTVQASPVVATTYTVIGTTNGCSDTATITVNVAAAPKDTVIVYPPGVICAGSTLLMQALLDTGYSYQWLLNGTPLPGATSAFYSATTAGSYAVRITTSAGCTITTHTVPVLVAPLPSPVITDAGNGQLCATGFAAYQWYLNGTALTGDTSSCITPAAGGNYTVKVTSAAGCLATSDSYTVPDMGVGNVTANQVKLYPNPATSVVNISAPQRVNVSLCSIDGRELMYVTDAKTIDLNSLANTIYIIKVYDKANTLIKVEKLVKAGW